MPFIEWSSKYSTGIPDIDKEHQVLFTLINSLHDNVEASSTHEAIRNTIDALVDYVDYHFSREEGLLSDCGYQDRDKHIAGHRKLQSQLESFRQTFEADPDAFDMEGFMTFLTQWLQGHILQSDMAYIPCIQRRINSIVNLT